MSRQSQRRFALIVIGVMALIAVAQHLGWIAVPARLLAPGIH